MNFAAAISLISRSGLALKFSSTSDNQGQYFTGLLGVVNFTGKAVPPTLPGCPEQDVDICLDNLNEENDLDLEDKLDYSDADVCKINLGYCMTYMCDYIITRGYASDCTSYKSSLQTIINNCHEQSTKACLNQVFRRIAKFKRQAAVVAATTTTKATSTSSTSTKSGSTSTTTSTKATTNATTSTTSSSSSTTMFNRYNNVISEMNVYTCRHKPSTCMKLACNHVLQNQLAKKCGAIVKPKLRRLMRTCKQATVEQCIDQLSTHRS